MIICYKYLLQYESIYGKINALKKYPGVAQFGSALEWGSRGRKFNSCRSDQNNAEPNDWVQRFFIFD